MLSYPTVSFPLIKALYITSRSFNISLITTSQRSISRSSQASICSQELTEKVKLYQKLIGLAVLTAVFAAPVAKFFMQTEILLSVSTKEGLGPETSVILSRKPSPRRSDASTAAATNLRPSTRRLSLRSYRAQLLLRRQMAVS
jgi:hypothetical protein